MIIILITQALLLVMMSSGWFIGRRIHKIALHRKGATHIEKHDQDMIKDAIAFVSGAIGVMLGLLLSLSVSQFQDTQNRIDQLGTDSIAIFNATNNFSAEDANSIRHDVVCTLRTFVYQDWQAPEESQADGIKQTALWELQLNQDVRNLPLDTPKQQNAYSIIVDQSMDIADQLDNILASSTNTIPAVIWVVIYFAAFVLSALLAINSSDKKVLARVLFGVTYGTQAVILLALTVLDFPLQNFGFGSAVTVDALQATYDSLEWQYPGQEWQDCPVLDPKDLVHSD